MCNTRSLGILRPSCINSITDKDFLFKKFTFQINTTLDTKNELSCICFIFTHLCTHVLIEIDNALNFSPNCILTRNAFYYLKNKTKLTSKLTLYDNEMTNHQNWWYHHWKVISFDDNVWLKVPSVIVYNH